MNEMKAGERPDTIYLQNLPTKWFLDPYDRSGALKDKPSEYVLKKVFQTFGEIRALDIPSLDPYRYAYQGWQRSWKLIFYFTETKWNPVLLESRPSLSVKI